MKRITRMVALDTSSTITGYAYFENAVLVESGTIDLLKMKKERFETMCKSIVSYTKDKKPHILVVEQPTFCNSPDTFRMLSEIVGTARGFALSKGADYVEYSPSLWRKLISNENEVIPTKRELCKPWDIGKVMDVLKVTPQDDNEADAILIGIARVCELLDGVDCLEDYAKVILKKAV